MKKIILLFTICISFISFSQTMRDIVYLKNGSIIKGQIIEMNPSKNLKIKTSSGSLFVYEMNEILKIEKEEVFGEKSIEKTSSFVSQSEIENFFSDLITKNRPALKFIGVTKKNGIKKEIYGQKIYDIEYELILEARQNIYINTSLAASGWSNMFKDDFSYSLKPSDAYESTFGGAKKLVEKGKRIVVNGTLSFEETDNGWRATKYKNKNLKIVSSDYITPQMAENIKKLMQKKQALYAKEGDWKKPDIPELKLIPFYLKVGNIPIFEVSSNKITIKKLCEHCRNDNIQDIEAVIKKAFNLSNRYENITEKDYYNSANTASISVLISRISNIHKGVDDKGRNKGFSCEISYILSLKANYISPQKVSFNETKTYTVSSSLWQVYLTKKSAFNAALKKLESKMLNTIIKFEPIALNVKEIELDKEGSPKYIIFENSQHIFNLKKLVFNVSEKKSLSIKSNRIIIGENLGNVVYKKSNFPNEIKCKIKKRSLRKKLKKYIGKEAELLGISR